MVDKKSKKSDKRGRTEASRGNLWGFDPNALCIIGGQKIRNKDEIGPLDTDDGEEHDHWDERLLTPITEEEIAHADAFGIDGVAYIAKKNGIDVVVAGRRKTRVGRLVNKRRKERGGDPLVIDCKVVRGSDLDLMGKAVSENEMRVNDGVLVKIAKAKRLKNKGLSDEKIALRFGIKRPVLDGWWKFDDQAIDETKRAAEMDRLSPTAAARIASIKDPVAQKKALDETLAFEGKASSRTARVIAGKHGSGGIVGITDKKTQRRLISYIEETPERSNTSEETIARREGMIAALKAVVGDEINDPWLSKKIDEVYGLMKTEARAKRLEKVQKQAKKAKKAKAEAEAAEVEVEVE